MNARALHEQQTHAEQQHRISAAMRKGKLVAAQSPTYPKPLQAMGPSGAPDSTLIRTSTVQAHYDGAELRGWLRPGAGDHERHPSRMGGRLVWRDGRTETVA